MKITSASDQTQHTMRRRMAATLIACLGILALALTPVATAAPASATAEAAQATVESTDEQAEEITFDDLRTLIDELHATGEVTFAGTRRLLVFVDYAEFYVDWGYPSRAVGMLQHFKDVASDPQYVLTASAREQLLAAADQLISQLSGT